MKQKRRFAVAVPERPGFESPAIASPRRWIEQSFQGGHQEAKRLAQFEKKLVEVGRVRLLGTARASRAPFGAFAERAEGSMMVSESDSARECSRRGAANWTRGASLPRIRVRRGSDGLGAIPSLTTFNPLPAQSGSLAPIRPAPRHSLSPLPRCSQSSGCQ
jgi:hypothetical protein